MKIHVGTNGFPLKKHSIYKHYEVTEISTFYQRKPKRSTLLEWHSEAPDNFRFVIPAPFALTDPEWKDNKPSFWKEGAGGFKPGKETERIWKHIDMSASAARSNTILFRTPPSFTPSIQNKENMMEFFQNINRKNYKFVWEPLGLWSEKDIFTLAEKLELTIAYDPFSDERKVFETPFRYIKIRNFMRSVFNEFDFEGVSEAFEGAKRIFVVVATPNPDYIAKKILLYLK